MSVAYSLLSAVLICMANLVAEAYFAGRDTKKYMDTLRMPRFAPPFWAWAVIGLFYYAVCFVILYRLFRLESWDAVGVAAFILVLAFMALNSFWNYLFFGLKDLRYSFILSLIYSTVATALFVGLYHTDSIAFYAHLPYMIYLIFGNYWGYSLMKLNPVANRELG
jgi:tryptophan-rich sensory protein